MASSISREYNTTCKPTADLAALKAHVPKHEDPGGGTGVTKMEALAQAEIDAMEPLAQAAYFSKGGISKESVAAREAAIKRMSAPVVLPELVPAPVK